MNNWNGIRNEVGKWSENNFGTQASERRLLGMLEELGELCHVVLKQEQSIRANTSTLQHEWDAIGDLAIYIFDYCYMEKIDCNNIMPGEELKTFTEELIEILTGIAHNISLLLYASETDKILTLKNIFYRLKLYCEIRKINLEACVIKTWEFVKKRDWKKYPRTGQEQLEMEFMNDKSPSN